MFNKYIQLTKVLNCSFWFYENAVREKSGTVFQADLLSKFL